MPQISACSIRRKHRQVAFPLWCQTASARWLSPSSDLYLQYDKRHIVVRRPAIRPSLASANEPFDGRIREARHVHQASLRIEAAGITLRAANFPSSHMFMHGNRRTFELLLTVLFINLPMCAQDYWVALPKPTHTDLRRVCFLDSIQGWVAGEQGAILKTTNGGETWLQQFSRPANSIRDLFMLDSRFGWAVTTQLPDTAGWYGTLLLKTTNGGDEWSTSQFPQRFFYTITFLDSLNGWMGGETGSIFHSVDGGVNWFEAATDSTVFSHWAVRNLKFNSPQYGMAVGGKFDVAGVVWRTTDGGQHWASYGVGPEPLNGIHFIDSTNVICVGGDLDYGAGMVRTTDAGTSWDYTYLGFFGEGTSLAFRSKAEAWSTLGFTGTIMCTQDTGHTWMEMFTPDSTAVYDVVFPDSLHGFMVGNDGTVLKFNTAMLDVPDKQQFSVPSLIELNQNYPNPFNPRTRIEFTLRRAALVSLKVYDLLGCEVATLTSGRMLRGPHSVEFETGRLSSGIYFYRLTAQSEDSGESKQSLTRKMVVLR